MYKDSSRGPISGRRGLTSSEPWPTRVDIGPEIGVIADVQCGSVVMIEDSVPERCCNRGGM